MFINYWAIIGFLRFWISHHFCSLTFASFLVFRWLVAWQETQLGATLLSISFGTSGPSSRTSKLHPQGDDHIEKILPPSYGRSAFSFSGIMKNAMKDRNTDFHLAEASLNFQIAFLPFCCCPSSISLSGFFLTPNKRLFQLCILMPVLNLTHWQLTAVPLWLIVRGQPLPSFSSGFGSRLGRVIKSVASSYTTHLETNQVCCSDLTRGRRDFRGTLKLMYLSWKHCLTACDSYEGT